MREHGPHSTLRRLAFAGLAGVAIGFFAIGDALAQTLPGSRGNTPGMSSGSSGSRGSEGGPRVPRLPDGGRPHRPPRGPGVFVIPPVGPPPPYYSAPPPTHYAAPPRPQRAARRGQSGVPPASERRYVPDEVVIEVNGNPPPQAADALARRFNLTRVQSLPNRLGNTTAFRWRIPDRRSVPAVIRQIEADRYIRSAQPNYIYTLAQDASAAPQTASLPTDVVGDPSQYALGKLRLSQAHGLARGDNVLVAVIDSGIDVNHPELSGVIADSFDALETTGTPHTHGTAIAGAIAAHARLMGVAPAARLLAIRAFDESGGGAEATTFAILRGMDWATDKGARIINMSFAGPKDPMLARSLAALSKKGIVVIAAMGNAGLKSPPLYPAADPNVIAVTATDAEDKLFTAANRGRHVAVAAPGVDILLPSPESGYQVASGTSFAAAHVSGIAALLLEKKADMTPAAIRKALEASARDLGSKGKDEEFGAGLVDAYQALIAINAPAAADRKGTTASH